MIEYPSAPTPVAPVSLLDVQTVDGLLHYWSDRALSNVPAAVTADGAGALVSYQPWLMSAPTFTFYRSLQTDVGAFQLQNAGGDSLAPEFERVTRRSTLEGALFVYRCWQAGGEFAWLEVHGTLSVRGVERPTAELTAYQILRGEDDTPAGTYSESCQLVWGLKRCGAQGATECKYSYKTCQVTEHYVGQLNNYQKNFTETIAATPLVTINRRRTL